jgi:hypothetical protein
VILAITPLLLSVAKKKKLDFVGLICSTSMKLRVNSTNVLNEGLRIGEIGRQMNSNVKLVEIGVCRK